MMNTTSRMIRSVAVLAAAVLLCSSGYGQEGNERAELLGRERQARDRIERLRREQDFLLFQKDLFSSDSKYLVLDLRAGRGTLNYRNRILKSFRFTVEGKTVRSGISIGLLQLSSKPDGSPRKRQLVFGNSGMIILAKGARVNPGAGKAVRVRLSGRDFAAIYYALEPGSMVYATEGSYSRVIER